MLTFFNEQESKGRDFFLHLDIFSLDIGTFYNLHNCSLNNHKYHVKVDLLYLDFRTPISRLRHISTHLMSIYSVFKEYRYLYH